MTTLGQIFSFIGALLVLYSVYSKNKKNMIKLQCCTNISCILANVFLKGYPGIVANTILATRHILEINNKLTKTSTTILCILIISVGLYCNNLGLFGLLPVVSSTTFIILAYLIKSVQNMRLCVFITQFLWMFYDYHIKSYPLAVVDFFIVSASIIEYLRNVYKIRKEKKLA